MCIEARRTFDICGSSFGAHRTYMQKSTECLQKVKLRKKMKLMCTLIERMKIAVAMRRGVAPKVTVTHFADLKLYSYHHLR